MSARHIRFLCGPLVAPFLLIGAAISLLLNQLPCPNLPMERRYARRPVPV